MPPSRSCGGYLAALLNLEACYGTKRIVGGFSIRHELLSRGNKKFPQERILKSMNSDKPVGSGTANQGTEAEQKGGKEPAKEQAERDFDNSPKEDGE
jgi:hypothetical protein